MKIESTTQAEFIALSSAIDSRVQQIDRLITIFVKGGDTELEAAYCSELADLKAIQKRIRS